MTVSSYKPGSTEVIALEADYIDSGLNTFVKSLVSSYSRLPVTMDTPVRLHAVFGSGARLTCPLSHLQCGYACSDHASWYKYGYPSTMPFEAVTGNDNPVIHTSSDTVSYSGFSWSHSLEFAKASLRPLLAVLCSYTDASLLSVRSASGMCTNSPPKDMHGALVVVYESSGWTSASHIPLVVCLYYWAKARKYLCIAIEQANRETIMMHSTFRALSDLRGTSAPGRNHCIPLLYYTQTVALDLRWRRLAAPFTFIPFFILLALVAYFHDEIRISSPLPLGIVRLVRCCFASLF